MRHLPALLLAVFVLSGCDDPPEKPNPLIGTWLLSGTNLAGRTFETRLVVDTTNGYTSQVSIPASEDENLPAYAATAGGYLLVTNGMLIDTMTHTSDTNANPPRAPFRRSRPHHLVGLRNTHRAMDRKRLRQRPHQSRHASQSHDCRRAFETPVICAHSPFPRHIFQSDLLSTSHELRKFWTAIRCDIGGYLGAAAACRG